MSDYDDLTFVEPEAVAELIKGPQREEVAVLDVRDGDFVGGNIKGAVNYPSALFYDEDAIDKLISEQLQGKKKVVVHCMLSQQRGPRSAIALKERLQQLNLTEPRVLIMRGGWRMFSSRYAYTQPELIEGAD